MQDLFIRIEATSYDAWLRVHPELAERRRRHGIADVAVYRDVEAPAAALFHARAEDVERAMEWFRPDTLREAGVRATVSRRWNFRAQPFDPAAPESYAASSKS
jgi:hypothetical protein